MLPTRLRHTTSCRVIIIKHPFSPSLTSKTKFTSDFPLFSLNLNEFESKLSPSVGYAPVSGRGIALAYRTVLCLPVLHYWPVLNPIKILKKYIKYFLTVKTDLFVGRFKPENLARLTPRPSTEKPIDHLLAFHRFRYQINFF